MMTTTDTATILLVSSNPAVTKATRLALKSEENIHLVELEVGSANLFRAIAELLPEVILLDFEDQIQPFYLVYQIMSIYPKCAVVAVLSESKLGLSDRALQSGAQAFIEFPYPEDQLSVTVTGLIEQIKQNGHQTSGSGSYEKSLNTFTVFSPKGGAGTTTVATNLAISLHNNSQEDVLLIDGKHLFGHVALCLNLRTGNSINDLIAQADMLDQRLIKQVVVEHTSGIHVLPSPNSLIESQSISPDNLFKVIQSLQQVFPIIVIDGGNTLNENTVTYMDASDKVLLVLNPDLASMRDIKLFMEFSTSLSYPEDKMLLLLNLTGRKENVQQDEVERILKMEIFGTIPSDENLALSSLNEGVPIVMKKPRHPIAKAFSDIAVELAKYIQTNRTQ